MKLIFEFSGEAEALARAELMGVLDALGVAARPLLDDSLASVMDVDEPPSAALSRPALTRAAYRYLFSSPPSLDGIRAGMAGVELPPGSVAVRSQRLMGLNKQLQRNAVNRAVGKVLADAGRQIDIEHPDLTVVPLIGSDVHVGLLLHANDPSEYEARKVRFRPFFSPVSLHPKLARALVNLTAVREGERLVDPFCGTGGILMEAAAIGAVPSGGDASDRMVAGTMENLAHFGFGEAKLLACDFEETLERLAPVRAIAADPPYGRSSSTQREPRRELIRRFLSSASGALESGGRLAVVLPERGLLKLAPRGLKLVSCHPIRVHRSLTRYFTLFQRG